MPSWCPLAFKFTTTPTNIAPSVKTRYISYLCPLSVRPSARNTQWHLTTNVIDKRAQVQTRTMRNFIWITKASGGGGVRVRTVDNYGFNMEQYGIIKRNDFRWRSYLTAQLSHFITTNISTWPYLRNKRPKIASPCIIQCLLYQSIRSPRQIGVSVSIMTFLSVSLD